MTEGTIFNLQRFSINDGPGIRTTVFLKGCPLNCWWCHNPESQKFEKELMFWNDRCINCGQCRSACNHSQGCILCGECTVSCPAEAREMSGRKVYPQQVLDEIKKDLVFYEQSGGGVTFSGGEPLCQPAFLEETLNLCRLEYIHTAVDTSGFAPWETFERITPLTDIFLYDLKHMDDVKHQKYTGVSNRGILENLQKLSLIHRNIIIRVPLIPGINDDELNIIAIGHFALNLNLRNINILPYHDTAKDKYLRLGNAYKLPQTSRPSQDKLAPIQSQLEELGLVVKIGG
ncbi:MAG: glycyl-radical enzyme activating protein [Bacillota bacterium]